MTYLCVIAGMILFILAIRTLLKNFISNFNASDIGIINIILVILIFASIIFSLFSFYNASEYVKMTSNLATKPDLDAMDINFLKESITIYKTKMIYDLIYGYPCSIISLLILKIIHIRRSDACNSSNSKWDLS